MAKVRLDKSTKTKAKGKLKPKAKPLTPEQREARRRTLRRVVNGLALAVVVGGFCVGYNALAAHVRESYAIVERPPVLTLVNRPAWMNDAVAADLASRLAAELPARGSTLDHDLLVHLGHVLHDNAWVRRVNSVRREIVFGRDTIRVDCEYRTPLAIVEWNDGRDASYRLVARDGVLLPPTYPGDAVRAILRGSDATTNLRVIAGVAKAPPEHAGDEWQSPDLKAGLDVAALLNGVAAARDITQIDVSNFAERRVRWTPGPREQWAAQIVLRTKADTDVFWGRPPEANDFLVEVSPQTKLANLEAVARHFHGRPWPGWVDLRADNGDAVQYLDPATADVGR